MSDVDCLDGILAHCRRAVESVDPAAVEALVEALRGGRRVFVYGSGRSGLVGQMFAVRLVQLGIDVHFVGEMTTPIIGKGDLTILISNTGRTSSVVQTAQIARRIGSEIFCITGTRKCPLVGVSDVSLVMDVPIGADVEREAPLGTVFEDSTLLLFDCIVSELMEREGATEADMRNRHAIWVRSLGLERGGQPVALRVHAVYGDLAEVGVQDDEDALPARQAHLRDHPVLRLRALGREVEADLGRPRAGDDAVLALGVGLDRAGQPAAARAALHGPENGRERVRPEHCVGGCTHPP